MHGFILLFGTVFLPFKLMQASHMLPVNEGFKRKIIVDCRESCVYFMDIIIPTSLYACMYQACISTRQKS